MYTAAYTGTAAGTTSIAAADLNGDGKMDLIVTSPTPDGRGGWIGVLVGNGNGTLQPMQTYAVGASPDAVDVADLNGDGKPDLIVANSDSASVSVLLGNGNGTSRLRIVSGTVPGAGNTDHVRQVRIHRCVA